MNTVKREDDQSSNDLKIIEYITDLIKSSRAKMDAMTKEGKLKKKPSVINSLSMDNTQKEFESRTSALHMLGNSLNPTSSMAQEMADILNEEIETHKICNNEPNSSTNTRVNVLVGPQLPRQRQRPLEIGDSSNGFNVDANLPLEALLERQWQPGREYMEQAQHFDIASLIACMYQLQNVENVALEKELDTITRRRDYLLAQSAQLAIPLAPQSSRNQAPAPPVPNNYNEGSIQPSKSNVQLNYGNIDPSLQARRPAQNLSNNKPSQIDIREGVVHDSRSGSRIQEIPTAQWSSSSLSSNEININGDQNLEDLLESHGEQGEEFLMEQAQHFNIPSILSSLSKLKKEIVTVEHKLNTFTRHYNHSLAVNSRQAKPNTPQSSKNQAPAHLVPNNHNEGSIQPSMSNFQLNDGNIEHSLQARHPAQNLSNNQSTVRSGNRINGNQRKILRLNSNSIASTQQSPNMTLPRHKYNTRCTIKKEFTSQ